ncbi:MULTISPECIES: PKD domain-containing protein, partial [Microbacterium]|uniref:PKD domain-containing protein n=1 Tax=Microbacterium TaxID=33882 RepID=UPI00214B15B5
MPSTAMAEEVPPPTAAAVPPLPETVSADALPTLQIDNGVVWTQTIVGNTVYAAGQFENVRPAGAAVGQNLTKRTNIVAYDLTTGQLIASFAPTFNNRVNELAASPDGKKLYVTGSFSQVNGQARSRFAVLDLPSGNLTANTLSLNNIGKAVYPTADGVYVAGYFTAVGSQPRNRVAKLNAAGTAVLPFSVPVDEGQVQSIVADATGSQVVFSGNFRSVGGSGNPGFGIFRADGATGAGLPLGVNTRIRNAGEGSGIMSLATDGTKFYGVGWHYGSAGTLEGSFAGNWADGSLAWIEDCHGDTYDIAIVRDIAYSASHKHYCGNSGGFPQTNPWSFNHATAWTTDARGVNTPDIYGYPDHPGTPRPEILNWYPLTPPGTFTGQNQAVWTVTGNDDYVIYGGEFPSVNGTRQQGLVRFAVRSLAPNKQGPRLSGESWTPSVTSYESGKVRLRYQTNWDRDDLSLTYRVYRDNETSAPISEKTIAATFWQPTGEVVSDAGLQPGASHRYRVTVTDPSGNVVKSPWVSVTVSNEAPSAYVDAVLGDDALNYWRLNEAAGATAFDWSGTNDLALSGEYTRSAAGAIEGDANTATAFVNGFGGAAQSATGPNSFTIETWIKTTSTRGGKIVGFGNANTGLSSSYDRQVYMDDAGRLWFGAHPGGVRTVNSTASYNDGRWHHVVASLGSDGMKLFVDGKRVAQRADVTGGQDYQGYWRVGGDNLNGWTNRPSSDNFNGLIDDVAIYAAPLSTTQIRGHFEAAGGVLDLPAEPRDAYGSLIYKSDPDFYWRFDETSGATVVDSGVQENPGALAGDYTRGAAGALGESTRGISFNKRTCQWWEMGCSNTNGGNAYTTASGPAPTVYSVETWFKTTTSEGGKLFGFADTQSGNSSNHDRHVFMRDDGRLVFGAWTGQENTVVTQAALNDGQWHHVVATQGPDGMRLYVDGTLRGTNPQTQAQSYSGYWRVGGGTTWGSSSQNLIGSFDEAAMYTRVLTADEVAAHHAVGSGAPIPNQAPVAAFAVAVDGLTITADAAPSTDSDGRIATYAWEFGDGGVSAEALATHTYATGGTYTVRLTVTDDDGATATTTQQVVVEPPNVAPTARFTVAADDLRVSVDAASSSDSDGTIASYTWDFGDGTTATGPTATHLYASAGGKGITLTVTDDDGATHSVTQVVELVAPNQAPTASFTLRKEGQDISVDAAASSDPDGTIVSYAWNFGDGSTGTGATATHRYGVPGPYTVTLTVTDNRGATATTTRGVDTTLPANVAPVAVFTSAVSGLSVSVDGSGSSDADGSIASYAWDFGD